MSGLRNTGGNITYVTTFMGTFRKRAKEGETNAVSRINKLGVKVWEEPFDTFSGHLIDLEKKEGDYGPEWACKFNADGTIYIINLYYSSAFTNGLLLRLPNIDLKKEITLKAYYFDETSKSSAKSVLNVWQEGIKIEPFWTKDDRRGLPEMEQVPDPKIPNKLIWSSVKQMSYLENYIAKKVKARLEEAKDGLVMDTDTDQRNADVDQSDGIDFAKKTEKITAAQVVAEAKKQSEEEDDDLPF